MDNIEFPTKPALERHHRRYSVVMYGKPHNYSLYQMRQGEERKAELSARIREIAHTLEVRDIYAPGPVASNAAYVDYRELTLVTDLGEDVCLWRHPQIEADVIMVPHGAAMMMSIGGCTGIAAWSSDYMYGAHAGRDCVLNRNRILGKEGSRAVEGVVETIMEQFLLHEVAPHSIHVAIFGSIPAHLYPHPLDHPEHSEFNKLMHDYIRANGWMSFAGQRSAEVIKTEVLLDIPRLVAAQFVRKGVAPIHIDLRSAYADPETMWLDGTRGMPRNLFMLVHR